MERLSRERALWRQSHPHLFTAKPEMKDGSMNLFRWTAEVPGAVGSILEGTFIQLRLEFPEDFPRAGPRVFTTPPLFHPNVYPSGEICSSFISTGWVPESTISDILLSFQALFANPNPASPANTEAFAMFVMDREAYEESIRRQFRKENTISERCAIELVGNEELKKRMLSDAYVPSENQSQNQVISLI